MRARSTSLNQYNDYSINRSQNIRLYNHKIINLSDAIKSVF